MLTFCRGGGISVYISRYNLENLTKENHFHLDIWSGEKNKRRKERYI